MFEKLMRSNELVGLTILLMMVMALVASQADVRAEDAVQGAAAVQQVDSREATYTPFTATIEGHFNGKALTISIDTMVRFGIFSLESE